MRKSLSPVCGDEKCKRGLRPREMGRYFLSRSRRLRTSLCEAELLSPEGELISRRQPGTYLSPGMGLMSCFFFPNGCRFEFGCAMGSTAA